MGIETKSIKSSYQVRKTLGMGTFGDVYSAEARTHERQLVALKVLRDTSSANYSYENLREVIFFRQVTPHENLVRLYELFLDTESRNVVLALECMRGNLYQYIEHYRRRATGFGIDGLVIAKITRDLLKGVEHIHRCGFVHRDIKPENVLWSGEGRRITVKLADFGLSRAAASTSDRPWTGYVATRWYRAPEQLFDLKLHTPAVDTWAVSLILYEICNLTPLFPGKTTTDMIQRILEVIGVPSHNAVGGSCPVMRDALELMFGSPVKKDARLLNGYVVTPDWLRWENHEVFTELLVSGLQWDPHNRPSASEMLLILRSAIYKYQQLWVQKPRLAPVHNRTRSI